MIKDLTELRTYAVRHILRRAKADYLLRHSLCKPWIASTQEDDMAWTDYKSLFFNFPRIRAQLDGAAVQGIANRKPLQPGDYTTAFLAAACHEILHVLWLHNIRSKDKHQAVWRDACEYAINYELASLFGRDWIDHLNVMYPDSLILNALTVQKLAPTTDNFYDLMLKRPDLRPKLPITTGVFPCKFCERAERADPDDLPTTSDAVRVLNHLPYNHNEREGIIKFLVAEQEAPRKIPWEMLLLGGIEDAVTQEQSWALPSRRNDLLPGWRHEKLLTFVWILDVSPSIDETMKKSFMNTVQAGINLYHDAQHRIIFFAEDVVADIMVSSGTDLSRMEIPCGSGTDLRDVWDLLDRDSPEYALVLTDLELSPVPKPRFTKIIWGIVGNQRIFDPDYGVKIALK